MTLRSLKLGSVILLSTVLFMSTTATPQSTPTINSSSLEGLTRFTADGVGASVCGAGCTVTGTAKGEPFGIAAFTSTFSADPGSFGGNGQGQACYARGSGSLTLTTPSGDMIFLEKEGNYCATSQLHVVEHDGYIITGGTGKYANVVGGGGSVGIGIAVAQGASTGSAYLHIEGNIKLH